VAATGSSVRSSALLPLEALDRREALDEDRRQASAGEGNRRQWRAREIAATFRSGGSSERGRKGGRKGVAREKGQQASAGTGCERAPSLARRRAEQWIRHDPALMKLETGGFSPVRFWSFLSSSLLASTPFLDEETVSLFSPLSLFFYCSATSAKY